MKILWSSIKFVHILDKRKVVISGLSSGLHQHQLISLVSLYCVKYYWYFVICYFVHIIICVLFVGREQSISCDNFLSEPIAVLFAIRLYWTQLN